LIRRVDPTCVCFSSLFFKQMPSICEFLLLCLRHYCSHEDFHKLFEDIAQCRCDVDTFASCIRLMLSPGSGENHDLRQLYCHFSRIFAQKLGFLSSSQLEKVSLCSNGHVCKPWTFTKGHGYFCMFWK
jgi:hypothetical protein